MNTLLKIVLLNGIVNISINLALADDSFNNQTFLNELVHRNIQETDFSAIIELISVKPFNQIFTDSGKRGYTTYEFKAKVITVLKGEPTDSIIFYDVYESGFEGDSSQNINIVSLCRLNNKLHSPGNGYVLAASKSLIQSAQQNRPLKYQSNVCL